MNLIALVLLAEEANPGFVGGVAGWTATGLLTAVVFWILYVSLPYERKQAAEREKVLFDKIHEKDVQIDTLVKEFRDERKEQRAAESAREKILTDTFTATIKDERDNCDDHWKELRETFERVMGEKGRQP